MRYNVCGGGVIEQVVVMTDDFEPVEVWPAWCPQAQLTVPGRTWDEPYRTVFVHCGPAAPLPASPTGWTSGTRWFR